MIQITFANEARIEKYEQPSSRGQFIHIMEDIVPWVELEALIVVGRKHVTGFIKVRYRGLKKNREWLLTVLVLKHFRNTYRLFKRLAMSLFLEEKDT